MNFIFVYAWQRIGSYRFSSMWPPWYGLLGFLLAASSCRGAPVHRGERASGEVAWFTPWVAVEQRQNGLPTRNIVFFLPFQSYLSDVGRACNLYLWVSTFPKMGTSYLLSCVLSSVCAYFLQCTYFIIVCKQQSETGKGTTHVLVAQENRL